MEALQKLVAGLDSERLTGDELKPKKRVGVLPKKGTTDRRIIRRYVKDGREHYLHATKGWRSRRV